MRPGAIHPQVESIGKAQQRRIPYNCATTADCGKLIDDLSWDSNFLGLKTGRLHCDREEQLLECLVNIKGDHYQLIYVFSDTAIDVRPADCRLIDVGGQVTYSKSLEITRQSKEQAHSEDSIGIYQGPDENESLLQLALLSGHLSRFRVDPWLPPGSFERLYRQWLLNNLQNKESSRVYISGHSNDPEGILTATWKQEHGTIDLLAVRQDSQGKGIGSKLLEHIENEAVKYSAHQIDVKTQMTNDAARRTYERNGYSLKESFYVYHLHLSSH